MDFYISVGLIAVSTVLSGIIGLPIYNILQLSGYKARGVFSYLKATNYNALIRYIGLMLFSFIAMIVFVGCFGAFNYVRYTAVALYLILAVLFIVANKKVGNKPKYTGRFIRLIVCGTVLMLILGAGVAAASYFSPYCQTVTAALAGLAPFVAVTANALMTPFEKLNNKKYVKRAKKKLAECAPTVIGITGSYGKTTAKNLLLAMLGDEAMTTPGNFNTPMGICKTVNDIYGGEKYFIAELGARYVGDIKELCDIVSPKYGIITAVGEMHLETFKTLERLQNTKFELAQAIPQDGLCVFNGYNDGAKKLFERETKCKKELICERISYKDLVFGADGTSFKLVIDQAEYEIKTKLLGAHIPELVCVCAAVALECGVSAEQIVKSVCELKPVEHRLELLQSQDPSVTVIDDAYNANPIGAKNALEVLKCFSGKRIIITPGFVELGTVEKECNVELGKNIAANSDIAFLVGSRAADIKSGAVANGMSEENIKIFSSRDEAVEALKEIDGQKAVLFENDLPENIK